jgi:hypothetical protein
MRLYNTLNDVHIQRQNIHKHLKDNHFHKSMVDFSRLVHNNRIEIYDLKIEQELRFNTLKQNLLKSFIR